MAGNRGSSDVGKWGVGMVAPDRIHPSGSAARRSGPTAWTTVGAAWRVRDAGGRRHRWWPSGPRCCCRVRREIPPGSRALHRSACLRSGGHAEPPTRVGVNSPPTDPKLLCSPWPASSWASRTASRRRGSLSRAEPAGSDRVPLCRLRPPPARPATDIRWWSIADDRRVDPGRAQIAAQRVEVPSRSDFPVSDPVPFTGAVSHLLIGVLARVGARVRRAPGPETP